MIDIEAARPEDYATFAALFAELDTGEAPPAEAYFARELAPTTWMARNEHGHVVGYAFAQIFGRSCYVRHLVTAPAERRRGVGRELLAHVARFGRDGGASSWELNVKVTNVAAIALYEGLGMSRRFDTVVVRIPWARLADFVATVPDALRASIDVREPREDEHALVEARLGLPSGIVTKNAHDPAKIVRAAFDAGEPIALGCFDPSFPGAFPLRVGAAEVAALLLEAFVPHARPVEDPARPWRADCLQVVVEDAQNVAAALLANGASEVFRITHLEGPLPRDEECPTDGSAP